MSVGIVPEITIPGVVPEIRIPGNAHEMWVIKAKGNCLEVTH